MQDPSEYGSGQDEGPLIHTQATTARLDLRRALRTQTAERHERLDAAFAPMMQPGGYAFYAAFIRMNHAAHAALEPILAASPLVEALPQWPRWSRLPQLRRDLEALGEAELMLAPFAIARPDLRQAFGVAYVLEGSRLGAIMIDRHFENGDPGRVPEPAARNYIKSAAGGETFLTLMQAASGREWSQDDMRVLVAAANATFDYLLLAATETRAVPA